MGRVPPQSSRCGLARFGQSQGILGRFWSAGELWRKEKAGVNPEMRLGDSEGALSVSPFQPYPPRRSQLPGTPGEDVLGPSGQEGCPAAVF